MKPKFLLLLSLLVSLTSALSSFKSQQVTILPTTPKGFLLDNIYGQNPLNNSFGGFSPIDSLQTTMNVFDPWGNIKTIYVNNSILNHPQPNICDFRDRHTYKLCANLDCDFCMASPHCGKLLIILPSLTSFYP